MKAETISPRYDWILCRWLKHESLTPSGIVLSAGKESQAAMVCKKAKVLAVGPGARAEHGKLAPMRLEAGSVVLTSSSAGRPVAPGERELVLMKEGDVLAVVTE